MYGNNYGGCNSSNNNTSNKNEYLKTIVDYVKPDILTVNEIDDNDYYHEFLLNGVFNINGTTKYKMGAPPNYGNSPIMNEIYFDSEKLELLSNPAITTNYRDIDIFKFRYTGKNSYQDIELNCVVAHLKAGSGYDDEIERANETNKLMNYLNSNNSIGNYIFSGDFNLYSASEQAYQNLLFHQNHQIRFYDPLDELGNWHNNSYYAAIHTQSTHSSGDCFSGGGMDDRFDFILLSDEILDGAEKIKYLPGSYKALGQDGQRLNQSLVYPTNNSAPANIIAALYDMSDHLPIIIDLIIDDNTGSAENNVSGYDISFKNPVKNILTIYLKSIDRKDIKICLSNIVGETIYTDEINIVGNEVAHISVSDLNNGIYFLTIGPVNEMPVTKKLVISN